MCVIGIYAIPLETASLAASTASTTLDVLDKIKRTTSTEITVPSHSDSFRILNNHLNRQTGAVFKTNINKLVNIFLKDFSNLIDADMNNAIQKYVDLIPLQIDNNFKNYQMKFNFHNGNGNMIILMFVFSQHKNENAVHYDVVTIKTDFEPSPPFVIVTDSDCDIMSCDRTDTIRYLPPVISENHIRAIIELNLGFMSNLLN